MAKLPRLTASQLVKILRRLNFGEVRQVGSHKIFKNEMGIRVTVPYHGHRMLHPKIIKTFLRDTSLTSENLKKLM